jgi:hypothetical protein
MNTLEKIVAENEASFKETAVKFTEMMVDRMEKAEEETGMTIEEAHAIMHILHKAVVDRGHADSKQAKALRYMEIISNPLKP